MKTLATLLLLLFINTISAQTDPLPLPTNGVWVMAWQNPFMPWVVGTNAYRLNGTINVNDTVYYQIERFDYCGSGNSLVISGYIREDSGKWYFRQNTELAEELSYDFTLEIGESISMASCYNSLENPQLLNVIAIEEITMYDGSTRRMWTLEYDETSEMAGNVEYWIEGLGNYITGPFNPLSSTCLDLDESSRCFLEDDQRIFPTTEFTEGTDCCTLVSISELSKESSIALYPIPTFNELTIQSSNRIELITISDLSGRLLFTSKPMSEFTQVNTAILQSGIYILTATSENGLIETQRFIKQ